MQLEAVLKTWWHHSESTDVNTKDTNEHTAIHNAAERGHMGIVQMLLRSKETGSESTTIPMVNGALRHAKELCIHETLLHLGRKGRYQCGEDTRINPDWSLFNNVDFTSDGDFESIMTGGYRRSRRGVRCDACPCEGMRVMARRSLLLSAAA